jgi:hypothetical protein
MTPPDGPWSPSDSPNARLSNEDASSVVLTEREHEERSLLSPRDLALVDAIAARVLCLLDSRRETSSPLIDASSLGALLSVSRSTVYEHAAELGALEVGAGAKPRLRFDPQVALEAWSRRSRSSESQPSRSPVSMGVRARRRSRRLGSEAHLLPVKGQEAA